MSSQASNTFHVRDDEDGVALSSLLRERLDGESWSSVKRLITTGKVYVDGALRLEPGERLAAGATVEIFMSAPRQDKVRNSIDVVHMDEQVAVVIKPVGLASVPYGDQEPDNALEAVRQIVRRRGGADRQVGIVHRLDKATSGVMIFPLTHRARTILAEQFRAHTIKRRYRCVVHGHPPEGRIESWLVTDRGDGLRGSGEPHQGKHAISHVTIVERLDEVSVCDVRLETGRTHQIRVHLAEAGHPLVGEPVYVRDYVRSGQTPLRASRLMLHAAELGFVHPRSGRENLFEVPPPEEFERELARLR